MLRIERHKNFFSAAECAALNAWAEIGVEKKWLDTGVGIGFNPTALRVTSRMYPDRYAYPEIVKSLSGRVRQFCGVSQYPIISGHGRDGVVVSYTYPGGDVYAHRDPPSSEKLATLRCNVMTQAADTGCVLHIDGEPVDIEVGELHCYLVSEHTHFATPVEGSTPRIMWMFGAHVPADAWNSGKIRFGEVL